MPELPEVETIRRGLEARILNVPISHVEIRKEKMVRGEHTAFKKSLLKNSFSTIDRRGKLLALAIGRTGNHLLIHLKMTGQLIYKQGHDLVMGGHSWPRVQEDELPNKYSHIILTFKDGSKLFFNDQRQFGYMDTVNDIQKNAIWETYGVEPLGKDFTWTAFQTIMQKRKLVLKAALLNQQIFAGIGNIYADEICFEAKVRPDRLLPTLSEAEQKMLYKSCRHILEKAVKHRGTTFSDYVDSEGKSGGFARMLKVYGRAKQPCLRCKTDVITKKTVAGRGTHFCVTCQQ